MKKIILLLIIGLCAWCSQAQSLLNSNYLKKSSFKKITINQTTVIKRHGNKITDKNVFTNEFDSVIETTITSSAPIDSSNSFFQTNPNFLAMINDAVTLVPNVDVQFTNVKIDRSRSYTIKAFTGSATLDTTLQNNALRLLLPEASKFGLKFNCIQPIKIKKRNIASINLDFNLLYKDFPVKKDSQITSTNSSIISHSKIGTEVILIEDLISFYGNYNYMYVLTGVDNMKTLFNKSVNNYGFWDLGFRLQFDMNSAITSTSGNLLTIDFGAIPVNGEIFKLYDSTHDNIIPTLRIGYAKTIN